MAKPIDWTQVARDIERFGREVSRFDREVSQAAQGFQRLCLAFARLGDAWRRSWPAFKIVLQLTFWIVEQIEAAKRNPSHERARVWLKLKDRTPKEIAEALPYLIPHMPDLRVPRPEGRPGGIPTGTLEMAEELDKRIRRTGEKPTTAAKRLLAEWEYRGDLKNPADHLVRVWRNRVLKSR